MACRSSLQRVVSLLVGLAALAALTTTSALAAGPGLPRTYQVQRIDSPNPVPVGLFSLGMNAVGDLNKDGKEDLLVPQVPGFSEDGQVFVFSGATGERIDTIPAPDPGNPTNAAKNSNAAFGSSASGTWATTAARRRSPTSEAVPGARRARPVPCRRWVPPTAFRS